MRLHTMAGLPVGMGQPMDTTPQDAASVPAQALWSGARATTGRIIAQRHGFRLIVAEEYAPLVDSQTLKDVIGCACRLSLLHSPRELHLSVFKLPGGVSAHLKYRARRRAEAARRLLGPEERAGKRGRA